MNNKELNFRSLEAIIEDEGPRKINTHKCVNNGCPMYHKDIACKYIDYCNTVIPDCNGHCDTCNTEDCENHPTYGTAFGYIPNEGVDPELHCLRKNKLMHSPEECINCDDTDCCQHPYDKRDCGQCGSDCCPY